MMGTFNCVYETPCGWCSKWDKKCDKKIGLSNYVPMECAHEWERTGYGGGSANGHTLRAYTIWRCKLCGAEKEVENYAKSLS